MGGSINIAARFNDGEAICIDGWTNFIPNMVINDTTFSGNDDIVRKTMLEAASHEHFAGAQPFRKSGYGIVVIDFISRQIHSIQCYTNFTRRGLNQLSDINKTGWKGDTFHNVLTAEAEGLLDAGRVTVTSEDLVECKPKLLDRKKAIELLNEETRDFLSGKPRKFYTLAIKPDPFTVAEYDDDSSITPIKEAMAAVGFPMTKRDGLNAMLTDKT